MAEERRSLSEIAYDTVSIPGYPLDPRVVDSALTEAGLDPLDERERTRFQRMVESNIHFHRMDVVAQCRFANEARRQLPDDAEDWQVIELAKEIEQYYEYMKNQFDGR